jgi:D-alanyl-D-alanine carboxypeptidase (penicillin-binding protein 5/6)
VYGVKTGTLEGSGSNLLFAAHLATGAGQLDILGVLLGGTSHDAVDREIRAWLESIAAGFQQVPVGEAGRTVGTVSSAWGEQARMVLESGGSLQLWSDTEIAVSMTVPTVTSAVAGQQVASVTWTAGPEAATVPVVLDATIGEPDAWWRLTHPAELFGW